MVADEGFAKTGMCDLNGRSQDSHPHALMVWGQINSQYLVKLMPRRKAAVTEANGGQTKYSIHTHGICYILHSLHSRHSFGLGGR